VFLWRERAVHEGRGGWRWSRLGRRRPTLHTDFCVHCPSPAVREPAGLFDPCPIAHSWGLSPLRSPLQSGCALAARRAPVLPHRLRAPRVSFFRAPASKKRRNGGAASTLRSRPATGEGGQERPEALCMGMERDGCRLLAWTRAEFSFSSARARSRTSTLHSLSLINHPAAVLGRAAAAAAAAVHERLGRSTATTATTSWRLGAAAAATAVSGAAARLCTCTTATAVGWRAATTTASSTTTPPTAALARRVRAHRICAAALHRAAAQRVRLRRRVERGQRRARAVGARVCSAAAAGGGGPGDAAVDRQRGRTVCCRQRWWWR
jgi:hypothetical protein